MRFIATFFPVVFLLSACKQAPHVQEARQFRDALAAGIEAAAIVEVVEHPHASDFFHGLHPGEEGSFSDDDFPVVEFARVRLDDTRRKELVSLIRGWDIKADQVISFCAFVPRHRIELRSSSGETSRVELCFDCNQMDWSARDLTGDRESWISGLQGFISGLGMRPHADWQQILRESGKAAGLPAPRGISQGS